MASKRPRAAEETSTTGDDFKLINSISWKMESRLHRAGINTFAELGSMRPAEIASQLGNPTGLLERITKENWVGQAQELADLSGKKKKTKANQSSDATESDQRYETFATELLLADDNQVLHTRLLHVPSGDEELWGGWDDKRLINFLIQRSSLKIPEEQIVSQPSQELNAEKEAVAIEETSGEVSDQDSAIVVVSEEGVSEESVTVSKAAPDVSADSAEAATDIPTPKAKPVSAIGELPAHKLEYFAGESELPTRLVSHNQPFSVRILLDLAKVVGGQYPLDYAATVQIRRLTDKKPQSLHYAKGKITAEYDYGLAVGNLSLNPGAYRLGAMVTLKPTNKNLLLTSDLNIRVEGGVLQVY